MRLLAGYDFEKHTFLSKKTAKATYFDRQGAKGSKGSIKTLETSRREGLLPTS